MGRRFLHALRRRGDALRAKIAKITASARRLPVRVARATRIAADLLRSAGALELRAALQRRADERLVRHSDVFDGRFYLAQCAADREAASDPVRHYLRHGAARGLDPGPLFDTSDYVRRHPALAASGENPLAHLLRSRAAARSRRLPALPAGAPQRPSLPFRPPPPGGPPCAVLVVDGTPPGAGPDVRGGRTAALVEVLRGVGHPVILFSAGSPTGGGPRAPQRSPNGLAAALAHLEAEGSRYGLVLLAGAEGTARHLAAVRAHAAAAFVVYDAAGVHGRRLARDAAAAGDPAAGAEAERLRRSEKVNAACADLVLVATAHDREALLAEVPQARVEVLPHEPVADAAMEAQLQAALSACGFRWVGAPAATREGVA